MSRVAFFLIAALALAFPPRPAAAANLVVCVGPCSNETDRAGFDRLGEKVYDLLQSISGVTLIDSRQAARAMEGLSTPDELRAAAKNLGADALLTFRASMQDGQIRTSAECCRFLEGERRIYTASVTGIMDPDAAARELAGKIAAYLTNPAARFAGRPRADLEAPEPVFRDIGQDPNRLKILRVARFKILRGYPDGTFRPNGPITEKDFTAVVERLLVTNPNLHKPVFETKSPKQPMNRVRAITVVVRSVADEPAIDLISEPERLLASYGDSGQIPRWGVRYAAFAIDHGYLDVEQRFRPLDPITRSELADLLARCLPLEGPGPEAKGYTGLVVDCRGLGIERSMNPKIVSEDGTQVYPDSKNLPPIEVILERGIVSYVRNVADSPRAGERPLEIKAVGVQGAAHDIAVIANADRDLILQEEPKGHFVADWRVTFLID